VSPLSESWVLIVSGQDKALRAVLVGTLREREHRSGG
jgi:hypothetical protein